MIAEFTPHDYLSTSGMHPERVKLAPLAVQVACEELLTRLNLLMSSFYGAMPNDAKGRKLTSGYRNPAANIAAGGAAGSHHMSGRAADVEDNDRELAVFCLADLALLEHIGLWIENPNHTKKRQPDGTWVAWVHFQTRPPKSGKRVFDPGTTLPR